MWSSFVVVAFVFIHLLKACSHRSFISSHLIWMILTAGQLQTLFTSVQFNSIQFQTRRDLCVVGTGTMPKTDEDNERYLGVLAVIIGLLCGIIITTIVVILIVWRKKLSYHCKCCFSYTIQFFFVNLCWSILRLSLFLRFHFLFRDFCCIFLIYFIFCLSSS